MTVCAFYILLATTTNRNQFLRLTTCLLEAWDRVLKSWVILRLDDDASSDILRLHATSDTFIDERHPTLINFSRPSIALCELRPVVSSAAVLPIFSAAA